MPPRRVLRIRLRLNPTATRLCLLAGLISALPIELAADSQTLNVAYPTPAGIFNSLTTTGSLQSPGATSTANNTYLNRYGGDVIMSGADPAVASASPSPGTPSAGHVVFGTIAAPYAKAEVAGALRAQDPGWSPIPSDGTGLEFYDYTPAGNASGYIEACTRSGGGCAMQNLNINTAGTGTTVQIGGNSSGNYSTVSIAGGIPDSTYRKYSLYVNGSSYQTTGGTSWATCDGRLKDVKGRFSAGLKEILGLNPVRFHFKKNNPLGIRPDDEHVGLIAQEVRSEIPAAVRAEPNRFLSMNDDPILMAMLHAIQEQQKDIEDLKARLVARRKP